MIDFISLKELQFTLNLVSVKSLMNSAVQNKTFINKTIFLLKDELNHIIIV